MRAGASGRCWTYTGFSKRWTGPSCLMCYEGRHAMRGLGAGVLAALRAAGWDPAADGLSAGGAAADHHHAMCGIAYVGGRDENSHGRGAHRFAWRNTCAASFPLLSSYPAKLNTIASDMAVIRLIRSYLGGRGGGQKPAIRADEPPDQQAASLRGFMSVGVTDTGTPISKLPLFDHERIALCAHRGRQRRSCVLGRAVSVGAISTRSVAEPAGPDRGAGRPPHPGLCRCEAPGATSSSALTAPSWKACCRPTRGAQIMISDEQGAGSPA